LVGLFANQSTEFVNSAIEGCGLDFAQLCGDEPADYYEKISARVIKQVKIPIEGDFQNTVSDTVRKVDSVLDSGSIPLLDRLDRGHLGGTGKSFDWNVAASLPNDWEFILAGGLNPINVSDAIASTRPWAVDVSTGVETLGLKDPSKIKAFSEAVLTS
jgi:phosphoribosylanthranilate isomerase